MSDGLATTRPIVTITSADAVTCTTTLPPMLRLPMDSDAEARRRRRAGATVTVYGEGEDEAMSDDDALYWDRIPVDERAAFVWQLSQEAYALAYPDEPAERGLSRSLVRIVRD